MERVTLQACFPIGSILTRERVTQKVRHPINAPQTTGRRRTGCTPLRFRPLLRTDYAATMWSSDYPANFSFDSWRNINRSLK